MSRNLSRPPSSISLRKSTDNSDYNKSFNSSGSWSAEIGRPRTPLSARASMGTDSARATPVPRPASAMGSARGGGGSGDSGGGVKVVVRTRPANQFELKEDGNKVCFQVATGTTCMLEVAVKNEPYTFTFDNVFDQHSRQIEVFEAAGIPTVNNVMSGYNSTIFAYGQTGAGKTHTMLGQIKSAEMRGLTPRVFEYLFKKIKEEQATLTPPPEYKVVCSNLEIYNETITDLLTPGASNLPLRNDTKQGTGTYVDGLKEVQITSTEDALELMEIGTNSRTVSATNANLTSSRSHCVFTCVISRKHKEPDGSMSNRISRLNLVDLAGSERAKVSDGKDVQTLKEGCNINKSLTCLGRVIKELVEAQRKGGKVHVPYRDSKLTALLQESLGGNARTTIIAGVSPMFSASSESLSTLQFVQRAKHIKNKDKKNEEASWDPQTLRIQVIKLKAQIDEMKKKGYAAVAGDIGGSSGGGGGIECDPAAAEKLEREEERCRELENELEEIRAAADDQQNDNARLTGEVDFLRNIKTDLQNNLDEMMAQFNGWQEKIIEAETINKRIFETERQTIMAQVEEKIKIIDQQEIEKKDRDSKISSLAGDLEKIQNDLKTMTATNHQLQTKLDTANNDITLKSKEIAQLNQDFTSVSTSLKESETTCAELDQKLSDANRLIQTKTNELNAVQAELDRARSTNSSLESNNADLREKIDELENNKIDLKKKITETEMAVEQLEREKQELQSEIELYKQSSAELGSTIEKLRSQITQQTKSIRDRETELTELKKQLHESQESGERLEERVQHRDATIMEMETHSSSLSRIIEQKEHELNSRKRNYTQQENTLQVVETQKTKLEEDLSRYGEMIKSLREQSSATKTEFDKARVDFEEQLQSKDDDMKRAQTNFDAHLKAREARFAEAARQFDEDKAKLEEEHQFNIRELQQNIEDLTSERDRKIRQHKEELREWENKYNASIDLYEDRLENNDKSHSSQLSDLQAAIRKKENDMRDVVSRLNAEIGSLQLRREEEVAKYEGQTQEREKQVQEELQKQRKEMTHKLRSLEDKLSNYVSIIEDRDNTIVYLEQKQANFAQNSEAKLKKEVSKLKQEIGEKQDEIESIAQVSDEQVDALERKLEDSKKKHQDDLKIRDHRILSLEEQLGEKDEFRNYLEDYNFRLNHYSQLNSTLYNVLEGINNTLADVDVSSRPPSVTGSYVSFDDRSVYDYDMPPSGTYSRSASRYGNGLDSGNYPTYAHNDYLREPAYNARA